MGMRMRQRRVEVRREEMRGRRRDGGDHVLGASRADAEGRGDGVGRGGLSLHVFFFFIPHGSPGPAAGPSTSPGASANDADALDRLDALSGEGPVRVA